MTTEKTTLNLPVATEVKPRRTASSGGGTSTATSAPTTIAEGRAKLKRKRLSGQERKDIVDMARGMTGYDSTSPIWGKRMPVVLTSIQDQLEIATQATSTTLEKANALKEAQMLVTELAKRIATGQIIGANS